MVGKCIRNDKAEADSVWGQEMNNAVVLPCPFSFAQVYADYESNPQLRQAIEFACRQFYVLHRKPFILQLFASVAPLLEFPVSNSHSLVSAWGSRVCSQPPPEITKRNPLKQQQHGSYWTHAYCTWCCAKPFLELLFCMLLFIGWLSRMLR